ncbi:hypothetical protein [Adonisia turfae]|uniref:Uncharacterized protein n=1 Tax=Adonisia turfae CCMR0081 TaxID=2292702 RepID=A0A6M0RSU7_9CYAN|nr:hypothetical protein [Adonisia turfae]NEZ59327.1 hypothetical protein [Adonisia turfae CCMR0081]
MNTLQIKPSTTPLAIQLPGMTHQGFVEFCLANRPYQAVVTMENPAIVSGAPELPALTLTMKQIW